MSAAPPAMSGMPATPAIPSVARPVGAVWADLVGQERTVQVLAAAATAAAARLRGEPGVGMTHAWLLTGPPGSGRSIAARAFAAALQCPDRGCGSCEACRRVLGGTFPDVQVVDSRKLSIGVKEVRALVASAARYPSAGRWQVMVVEDADRLTDQAGNALLKALEEPTAHTVWLLCAPAVDDVLPTVRSRCRYLSLRTPPTSAVADVLVRRDGVDPAMASFAARAAQGHIGRARRLATDEQARLRRNEVMRLPQSLDNLSSALGAAAELVQAATEEADAAEGTLAAAETEGMRRALGVGAGSRQPTGTSSLLKELESDQKKRSTRAKRDGIDRALVDLAGFYRDVLVVQSGAGVELVNEEMRDTVTTVARTTTPETTVRRIGAVLRAREAIEVNVAPLLAVEAMAVALRAG